MTGPFTACKSDISNLEKLEAWRAGLSRCMRVHDRQPQRYIRGIQRLHTHTYITYITYMHRRVSEARSGAGVREG